MLHSNPKTVASALMEILTESLLPAIENYGVSRVILVTQPLKKANLPSTVAVWPRRIPNRPVKARGRNATGIVARWPGDHQIAMSVLYTGFVYRGEAHMPVRDAVIQCPENHFIFFPPDTPMPDGTRPHRERDEPAAQNSDIFWIKFWPYGVECHLCHTRGEQHLGGGFGERAFIASREISLLSAMLMDELTERRSGHEVLSRHYLLSLLCIMRRHLEEDEVLPHSPPASALQLLTDDFLTAPDGSPTAVVHRAQEYIAENLGNPLSIQSIARATFTSRANLAKCFRSQTGQTAWEYIIKRRIEESKLMLTQSDIAIEHIGRIVGFPNASHFATRFSRTVGISPGAFRQKERIATSLKAERNARATKRKNVDD